MENTINVSKIRIFGIIAMVAVIGFAAVIVLSVTGCATGGAGGGDITVTVTGDFSEYSGWKAYIAVGDDAYAMPLNVRASTASLPFSILRMDNDKAFTKAGSYMIILWFRKDDDKSTDVNFVIMSKPVSRGENSIAFSSFSEL